MPLLTRRRLLSAATALTVTPLAAACGGATTTVDTTNPAAIQGKIVHWTNVAERMKVATTPNTHFVQGNMGYYFATFTERKSNEFRGSPTHKFQFTPWPIPKGGRRVNYGGNHCYFLTTGSKTPDVAWKFLEHLNQDEIILRFTERYDRIPVKIKVAESQAYQKNDPFLKLAVEEMRVRKFHVGAPGGGEIQALHNRIGMEAASGQRPVREVLRDYQAQMQQILDKYKQ